MLAVRHYPDLVTPGLRGWLSGLVKYDDDGRDSRWLFDGSGPMPPELTALAVVVAPGATFSGVLLQAYRDGGAVTPCHTDKGGTGDGFILSLGAPRTFRIHPVAAGACDDDLDAVRVECREGTVLVMDEAFHAGWHHQVIADPGVTGEKLSLVFRTTPRGA
jgi:alkylated DNA repair dioxygenase AlkB